MLTIRHYHNTKNYKKTEQNVNAQSASTNVILL